MPQGLLPIDCGRKLLGRQRPMWLTDAEFEALKQVLERMRAEALKDGPFRCGNTDRGLTTETCYGGSNG